MGTIRGVARAVAVRLYGLKTVITKNYGRWAALALVAVVAAGVFSAGSAHAASEATSGLIANVSGSISGTSDTQNFKIPKTHVSPSSAGGVLVAITVHGTDSLNPGAVTLCTASDNDCSSLASQLNLAGGKDGYVVAKVNTDTDYTLKVNAEKQTHGAYAAKVMLAGDVDNNGTVNTQDALKIATTYGAAAGTSRYSPAADVDGDGHIGAYDLLLAVRNYNAKVLQKPQEPVNPLDVPLPANALTVTGVNAAGLNSVSSTITFHLAGSTFSTNAQNTAVKANDQTLSADKIQISSTAIVVSGALQSGKNTIKLTSLDEAGRSLYYQFDVWAGQGQLSVRLVDAKGQDFKQAAHVTLTLPEDKAVSASGDTSTGTVSFANVPDRTVLVTGTAAGNVSGVAGGIGSGTLTIVMNGLGTPSSVDNNDFSQGTAGWEIGSAPVTIVNHVEQAGPTAGQSALQKAPKAAAPAPDKKREDRSGTAQATQKPVNPVPSVSAPTPLAAAVDQDLSLGTAGEGLQSIARTFTTDAGVSAVQLRYRFVTSEVPGGYYGTKYNDYFNVSLRSQKAGVTSEANSMNGLGLGAFDAGGSTAWRDVTLPVNKDGDTIAINLGVANVADGLYGSQVVVDVVKEIKDRVIPTLTWNKTTGGLDLRYKVEAENGTLTEARDIAVTFATGPGYDARTGGTLYTKNVAAGTASGEYGPFHIDGSSLANDPAGATHLIAASSKTDFGSIADVQITYGANANPAVVSAGMTDLIKDSLRASGQASASINSTARNAQDQARAMFNNLVNPAHTIAQNITIQLGIYANAGDAVINVFANNVSGLTRDQVVARSAQIQAAMVTEINNQGCQNVTKHCADPAVVSVVDVGASAFNGSNGPFFVAAVQSRAGAKLIDERATNSCYHIELPL